MTKRKRSGPTFFGSLVLFCVILIGLRILYAQRDQDADSAPPSPLTNEEREESVVYDVLLDELGRYADEVVFYYDCTDTLLGDFTAVCRAHPELFWLSGGASSRIRTQGEITTVQLLPDLMLAPEEIPAHADKLEEAIAAAIGVIDADATDYEKILAVHDYIIRTAEYDDEAVAQIRANAEPTAYWKSSSAYGCLVEGRAVCSGYAAAFQLLMHRLGIDCIRVTGRERESGVGHEWNCVRLGKGWYYVDVTWDDPAYVNTDSVFRDDVAYEYCLLPDEVLFRTHEPDAGQDLPVCADDSYHVYRDFGQYLAVYDFDGVAAILERQADNFVMSVQFASKEEAERAARELFDERKIYEVSSIRARGFASVSYTIGKTGLLRMKGSME